MAEREVVFKINGQQAQATLAALEAQINSLNAQIAQTNKGTPAYSNLIQEAERAKAALQSLQKEGLGKLDPKKTEGEVGGLTRALGKLPGPLGEIARTADDAGEVFEALGKTSFSQITSSLGNVFSQIGKVTGITKIYTVLNNALSKSFVAVGVGEAAAATGARALSAALVATGIGAFVVLLGTAISSLDLFSNKEEEAKEEAENFAEALNKVKDALDEVDRATSRENKKVLADLRARGASEVEIRKEIERQKAQAIRAADADIQIYTKKRDEAIKSGNSKSIEEANKFLKQANENKLNAEADYYIQVQENRTEDLKDQKDAQEKANQQSEKNQQERLKRLEDAYNKETKLNEQKYTKLANDAKLAGKETEQFEIDRLKAQIEINKKYGKDYIDLQEQVRVKEYELGQKRAADLKSLQEDIRDAEANTAEEKLQLTLQKETEKYDKLIELAKKNGLDTQELEKSKNEALLEIQDEYNKAQEEKRLAEEQKRAEERNKIMQEQIEMNNFIIEDETLTYDERRVKLEENRAILEKMTWESESAKTRALKENSELRKQIDMAELQAKTDIVNAQLDIAGQFGNLLQQIAGKNKALAIAGIVIEQASAIGKIVANTAIANAKSVAAMPLTAGQPWVTINTISAGLSIASTIAAAAKSIREINSSDSAGGGGAAGSQGPMPSKFAKGGLLTGRTHANGGIMSPFGELEGGEYVVNRASTMSFLPMLEAINSLGAGQQVSQGNLSSNVENSRMASASTPIIKTYVVASDVTSQQEADMKISQIARI